MNRYQLEQLLPMPTELSGLIHGYVTGRDEVKMITMIRVFDGASEQIPWYMYLSCVLDLDLHVVQEAILITRFFNTPDEYMEDRIQDIYNTRVAEELKELLEMFGLWGISDLYNTCCVKNITLVE